MGRESRRGSEGGWYGIQLDEKCREKEKGGGGERERENMKEWKRNKIGSTV